MAGASPSFTDTHVVKALLHLEAGPLGRKRLTQALGVGEGSVRTIIKRLDEQGLITSSPTGHSLTEAGRRQVYRLMERFTKPAAFDSGGLLPGVQSAVVVKRPTAVSAVALRDAALKAGAEGAVTVFFDGGIRFLGGGLEASGYPRFLENLSSLELKPGYAAVIGFSSDMHASEDGALSAAMMLSGLN